MVEVSVIIPMYNTEAYIRQCLESVLRQTYPYLEILVIDDGSTDLGIEICRQLSRNDNRIQLYIQERKGVSAARNRGLEEASGKYIFFLDSDDAIHPHLLEEYVSQAEKNQTDLTFCICTKLNDPEMESKAREALETERYNKWKICGKAESEEWFHREFQHELSRTGGKMIRHDVIRELRFDENLSQGEDTEFIHRLILKKVRMAYWGLEWYYYRNHAKSTTHLNGIDKTGQNFQICEIIKKREYEMGHISWALVWDEKLVWNILNKYLFSMTKRDEKASSNFKQLFIQEMKHPLFKNYPKRKKILFYILFYGCSFLPFRILWRMKQRRSQL